MAELEVIEDGAVLIGESGLVQAVGPVGDVRAADPKAEVREIDGVLFPGFVDSHTHAVFGMARLEDRERRARGIGYKEIAAAGGGILSTVHDVRERSESDLLDLTRRRLAYLVANGTTTVEVKSGYGLQLDAELKQLSVIRALEGDAVPAVIPTFLGAHEVPAEYRPHTDDYVEVVVREMLPKVREQGIARYCDVFCEPGVFSPEQTRRVLLAATEQGFGLKLHADELDPSGGAELAVTLGAVTADHLAAISDRGITALAEGETIGVLLPGTMMFLGQRRQAPARRLIDAGAAVALATDFNPGSSPGMSLPLMAGLAVSQMGLVPAEALIAITANGAAAVGEAHTRGQIAPGFRADLALAKVRDWRELIYWYGISLIEEIWVSGRPCHLGKRNLHFLV